MRQDSYALNPDAEAQLAAEDYRDAATQARAAGHAAFRTGDWTGYAEAFAQLQDTAAAAIAARRHAHHAASTGPQLRVVR